MESNNLKTLTIEELQSELSKKVVELNNLYATDAAESACAKAKKEADEIVSILARKMRDKAYAEYRSNATAMIDAIKAYSYTVQRVIVKNDQKLNKKTASIDTVAKQINLRELEEFVDHAISIDSSWAYRAKDLARFLTMNKADALGLDWKRISTSFKLSRGVVRNQEKDPTSNKSLIELLQAVIDMMVFEPFVAKDGTVDETKNKYKVLNRDIEYIKSVSSGKGKKALSVKSARGDNDQMIYLVHDVAHHLVTGAPYSIEYKSNE